MSADPAFEKEVDELLQQLEADAAASGYHLNPDQEFTRELVRGLVTNQKRYGYISCPCRIADGKRENDLDIICPCDYRDPDLNDFGACYCALYVTKEAVEGTRKIESIPERRPVKEEDRMTTSKIEATAQLDKKYPVWRCKVCGYLCARNQPPDECPICKVSKDRFERFM
jgi:ferredoxin-thioredoxin reductase catalytic chain